MTLTVHVPYSLLVVLAAAALLGLTCWMTRPKNTARVIDLPNERVRRALATSPARTVPPSVLRGSSSPQENERVFRDPCSTSCPELSMSGAPSMASRRAAPARPYRPGTAR